MPHPLYKTRDGFYLERDNFEFPHDFAALSRDGKYAAAVCDMFLNGGFCIESIRQYLDEDYGHIVRTLIAEGVFKDRRLLERKSALDRERRPRLPGWLIHPSSEIENDPSGGGS